LPVIEIQAPEGRYDYQNKYFGDATRYLCPAPIDAALTQQIQSLSVGAFETLQCAGWARADLMWNGKTDPMLLEINTSPGMTDHSLVPMAAQAAGISYDELVLRILAQASLKIGTIQ
jgi:D-alanine-D-alanine ligase